ncbi:hypothetical protein [Polaromonas sp.]|jgi:hypothetical protein|uniref:hypothetical protein n=1 Tax=Polaromonas sp. TaxID=1869339 RepID=UPI002BCD5ED5|nr:hypothetical protein [Polaromonas sp.]HQS38831.1 hypothetical protein [Polaromonas sp.]
MAERWRLAVEGMLEAPHNRLGGIWQWLHVEVLVFAATNSFARELFRNRFCVVLTLAL